MAKNSGSIPRHTYRAEDIVTCLMLYVYCGSSYRSIPRILRVMRLRQGMEVGAGFNSKDVKDTINEVAEDVGRVPQFMLSDGGKNLEKGASEAGLAHHHDVGHKFANILKKVYGEDPVSRISPSRWGKRNTGHWTRTCLPSRHPTREA